MRNSSCKFGIMSRIGRHACTTIMHACILWSDCQWPLGWNWEFSVSVNCWVVCNGILLLESCFWCWLYVMNWRVPWSITDWNWLCWWSLWAGDNAFLCWYVHVGAMVNAYDWLHFCFCVVCSQTCSCFFWKVELDVSIELSLHFAPLNRVELLATTCTCVYVYTVYTIRFVGQVYMYCTVLILCLVICLMTCL